MGDHVDDEDEYHAGVEYLAEQDEKLTEPMTAEELTWTIGYHEGDMTRIVEMLAAAEERHLHPKYRSILRSLVRGHEQAIKLLREELQRKQIENREPPSQ